MNYETSQPWYCFPIAKINWLTTLLVTPIGPLGGAPAFCRLHPLSWFIHRSDYSEFYFFNIFIHIRRRRTAVAPNTPSSVLHLLSTQLKVDGTVGTKPDRYGKHNKRWAFPNENPQLLLFSVLSVVSICRDVGVLTVSTTVLLEVVSFKLEIKFKKSQCKGWTNFHLAAVKSLLNSVKKCNTKFQYCSL